MARLDPIEWRVWWVADEPLKAGVLIVVILIIPLFLYGAMPDAPGFAGLGFLILLLSFGELLLPTFYRLTRDSIRWRILFFSRSRALSGIQRVLEGPTGFWLSPSLKDSLLDDWRGLWLRLPKNKPEIRERVHSRLQLLLDSVKDS
ncbi:MAG: hypothetical protein V2G42_02120 [bacterium JZ-2024 1]